MSTQPLSDNSAHELNRMLKRLMRRQGVTDTEVPNFESWHNFILAVDQTIEEFSANRKLLEQSVQSTSLKLQQAY